MKKIFLIACSVLTLMSSCSKDDDGYSGVSSTAKELGLEEIKLSKNANSSEIGYFVTNAGDTIRLNGEKDELGATKDINILQFVSSDNDIVIRFDDSKMPRSIETKNGVSIDMDWLSKNSALVKVLDSNTNTYISTIWYTDSVPVLPAKHIKKRMQPRSGEAMFSISDNTIRYQSDNVRERLSRSTPVDEVMDKLCVLNISQCGVMTDMSSWISLRNAKTHKYIENIYYARHPSTGVYNYIIPSSSFPAKASNQDLCQKIDFALAGLEGACTLLAGMSGLSDWIAIACASTGIGVPPAAVLAAITKVAVVSSVTLQVFLAANGTSGLMSVCNPDWYYKEYVAADLELYPYIITKTDVIDCDKITLTPDSEPIYLDYDVDGEPTIDSFALSPAYPAQGESYVATANFHCVPEGSSVIMHIIGTDGYEKTEHHNDIGSSGTVNMYVPGAETGVYDVCTITINTPDGDSYSMKASLVFGS